MQLMACLSFKRVDSYAGYASIVRCFTAAVPLGTAQHVEEEHCHSACRQPAGRTMGLLPRMQPVRMAEQDRSECPTCPGAALHHTQSLQRML